MRYYDRVGLALKTFGNETTLSFKFFHFVPGPRAGERATATETRTVR